jgi:hypothetical protein
MVVVGIWGSAFEVTSARSTIVLRVNAKLECPPVGPS